MTLQELIIRGKHLFGSASERLALYSLVNGKHSLEDLATSTRRHVNNVRRDIAMMVNAELLRPRIDTDGRPLVKAGSPVFEKTPLARTVSIKHFRSPLNKNVVRAAKSERPRGTRTRKRIPQMVVGNETDVLTLCKHGEDQHVEFKSAGTDVRKITKEIAAMLNSKSGGVILYGVDDHGVVHGSDVSRQQLDQPLQNSIKSSIDPPVVVTLKSIPVLSSTVIAIIVPPWNRRDVYQFDEKVYVRKGTNVFGVKAAELRKLSKGQIVV